jgi:K+ transporter
MEGCECLRRIHLLAPPIATPWEHFFRIPTNRVVELGTLVEI